MINRGVPMPETMEIEMKVVEEVDLEGASVADPSAATLPDPHPPSTLTVSTATAAKDNDKGKKYVNLTQGSILYVCLLVCRFISVFVSPLNHICCFILQSLIIEPQSF